MLRLEAEGELRWSGTPGGATGPGERGLAVVTGDRLWVLGQAGARLKGERVVLPADGRELAFTVPAGERLQVDLGKGAAGLWLGQVVSTSGQPVARLLGGTPAEGAVDRIVAVASQAAVAARVGDPPRAVEIWDGGGGDRPLDVRVRVIRLALPQATPPGGLASGEVASGEVLAGELPSGAGRIHLALAPGVVGVVVRDGQVASVHWGRESIAETLASTGGRLLLGRLGTESGAYSISILPDADPPRLDPSRPLILARAAAGTLRLEVPAAESLRVRVRGVNGPVVLIGADGRIGEGSSVPLGAGGTLLIPHGPGRVMAWLERDDGDASALWGGTGGPSALRVRVPAVVVL